MATEYRALPGGDGGEWAGPLADPRTAPRTLAPVAASTAGQPVRKMPIKTRPISGNYEGLEWSATVRTNVSIGSLTEMTQLDSAGGIKVLGEVLRLLPQLLVKWDIPDEEGNPLSCDEAGVRQLPNDLLMDVMNQALTAGNTAAEVDKSDQEATPGLPR